MAGAQDIVDIYLNQHKQINSFNLLLLKAKHVIVWILQMFLCILHRWTVNINRHGCICIKMIVEDAFCFHFQLAKDKNITIDNQKL